MRQVYVGGVGDAEVDVAARQDLVVAGAKTFAVIVLAVDCDADLLAVAVEFDLVPPVVVEAGTVEGLQVDVLVSGVDDGDGQTVHQLEVGHDRVVCDVEDDAVRLWGLEGQVDGLFGDACEWRVDLVHDSLGVVDADDLRGQG